MTLNLTLSVLKVGHYRSLSNENQPDNRNSLSVTVDILLTPMNKQEAADYLGVSTIAIKRYTQKGK